MVQNGNFNEISIKEARAICDNLQIGDIVVLDERMANTRYLNDKFFLRKLVTSMKATVNFTLVDNIQDIFHECCQIEKQK